MLLKRPGFSLITVLTLSLGIGATAAIYSLIEGVLLQKPPYEEPEQMVLIASTRADGDLSRRPQDWAAAQWLDWDEKIDGLEGVAGYLWSFSFLVSDEGSESLEGMSVSRDYFRVTGLEPQIGRVFNDDDVVPGAPPVIVLGHDLWQRKFGGDPDIVGKTLRISRRETPPTVIGVMPPGIRFLPAPARAQEPNYDVDALVDYWTPVTANPAWLKRSVWNVVARLGEGSTLAEAQAELRVLTAQQAQAEPLFDGAVPQLQSLVAVMNRDGERILLPLLGAAVLVLLIACGNAAAMLLVQCLGRQREYGVRSAMGAGRFMLFRQVAIESLLLALLGGVSGFALAALIVRLFRLIGGHAIPRLDAVTVGWPILLCGLGSALLAALVAGLYPALRASRLDPVEALKGSGPKSSAGRGERRLLSGVTLVQTALTLTLLVGAGLLIRTMVNLSRVAAGYETGQLLTMSVTAVEGSWTDFHVRALEEVSALPGVERAAFAWGVPLTGNSWPGAVEIEGQPTTEKEPIALPLRAVTPGYFELLGLEVTQGRDFRDGEGREDASVAIINESLAKRFFASGNPLGKKLWTRGRERPASEIVGVVEDARTGDLTRAAEPEIYVSLWQNGAFSKHLVVRTATDPLSMAGSVQQVLRAVDPTVAVENVETLEQVRSASLASQTFAMQLLVGFAAVATVLTLGGIFGVLTLALASRRREIAIRAAVGAPRRSLARLILAEGARLILVGGALGLLASTALSRVLDAFLYGTQSTDPATLVVVGLSFASVTLLACWLPAHRATRVDPLEALREE